MKYLEPKKIQLYLKLGKEIYQFIKIGQYFESKTFEYVSLSKSGQNYIAKLVQVLDYMYDISPSIDEFETVEELEGECEFIYEGTLEQCLSWANTSYQTSSDKWVLDVIDDYKDLVAKELLGQGDEPL